VTSSVTADCETALGAAWVPFALTSSAAEQTALSAAIAIRAFLPTPAFGPDAGFGGPDSRLSSVMMRVLPFCGFVLFFGGWDLRVVNARGLR